MAEVLAGYGGGEVILIRKIYNSVSSKLLEPGGLSLGVITEARFLEHFRDTVSDFLSRTEVAKRVLVIQQNYGQNSYSAPPSMSEVENVFSDGKVLQRSYQSLWNEGDIYWRQEIDEPFGWAEDRMSQGGINIRPAPNTQGQAPDVSGIYGVVSGSTDSGRIADSGYGTIADVTGEIYSEPEGLGYGIPSGLIGSSGNLTLVGTACLSELYPDLDSVVEGVPDSMWFYIMYGVLAKIWSDDGESKDDLRAKYAFSRFEEGVRLARRKSGVEDDGE